MYTAMYTDNVKCPFADTTVERTTESRDKTQAAVHLTQFTRRQRNATVATDIGRFSENRRARSVAGFGIAGARSAQIGLCLDEHY